MTAQRRKINAFGRKFKVIANFTENIRKNALILEEQLKTILTHKQLNSVYLKMERKICEERFLRFLLQIVYQLLKHVSIN